MKQHCEKLRGLLYFFADQLPLVFLFKEIKFIFLDVWDVSVQPVGFFFFFFFAIVSLHLLRLFCFLISSGFRDRLTLSTVITFQLEILVVLGATDFVHICDSTITRATGTS